MSRSKRLIGVANAAPQVIGHLTVAAHRLSTASQSDRTTSGIFPGSAQSIDLLAAADYGVHYFFLNPLYHLISIPKKTVAVPELILYGSLKVAILAWTLWKSNPEWRPFLLTFIALDLVNAALLGVERFDLALDTTLSWRYQYLSLLAFGPFAGILLSRCQRESQLALFVIWILVLAYPWRRHAPRWAGWRGTDIRMQLAKYPRDARFDPSSITVGRAQDLRNYYRLH